MEDYLLKYLKEDKFDFSQLINDDFIEAIRLCFNNRRYISCTKLLVSFIDSYSYVIYGESSSTSFKAFLDDYCKVNTLGITSEELWEHRNALLHITGIESYKVKQGKVKKLMGYVGKLPTGSVPPDNTNFFEIYQLILLVGSGLQKHIEYLNANPEKYEDFINRYDAIVSDCRYLVLEVPNSGA